MFKLLMVTGMSMLSLYACTQPKATTPSKPIKQSTMQNQSPSPTGNTEVATLGGGCFWCVEAVYQELKGVTQVVSGYSGGKGQSPTYKEISTGTTGHAEVIQITFDTTILSYEELLQVFFSVHDPTTLNRQGADVGTQYRSVIFYHSDAQRQKAEALKAALTDEKVFDNPIVTEITEFSAFYKAEEYHQNFYRDNPNYGYCTAVINPKMQKFRKTFKDKLQTN